MTTGVGIDPQKQIELSTAYLHCAIQIAPLECCIENIALLALQSWIHAFKRSIKKLGLTVELLLLTLSLKMYVTEAVVAQTAQTQLVALLAFLLLLIPVPAIAFMKLGRVMRAWSEVVDAVGMGVVEFGEFLGDDVCG